MTACLYVLAYLAGGGVALGYFIAGLGDRGGPGDRSAPFVAALLVAAAWPLMLPAMLTCDLANWLRGRK